MITQGSGDIYYFLLDGILDVQRHANMPSAADAKQTRRKTEYKHVDLVMNREDHLPVPYI